MCCTSVAGVRLPAVAEEGGREAAAQQQVPPQQSGQEIVHKAAATPVQGTDAAVRGDTSGDAAETVAAELSMPLTRKRSRQEAELAGAHARPSPAAQTAAADSGIDLHGADAAPGPAAVTAAAADSGRDLQRNTAPSEEQNGVPHGGVQFPENGCPGARIEGGQAAPGNTIGDQVQVHCPVLLPLLYQ